MRTQHLKLLLLGCMLISAMLTFAQPTVIFSEDFAAGVMPPAGWSITPDGTTNWIIVTATYAGGESPEGKFYGWPGVVGTTRLITPIINTDGFATLELEFKDKTQGATNPDYSFKIETTSDGGTTWNEVWSITPNGSWAFPQVETITIDNADVGSTNFQYCISYVSTTNSGAYHYNFDDFVLTGIPAGTGYSVTYNVEDATANPIAGAEIILVGNDTLTTNAVGQAVFTDIAAGTYTYNITAVGFMAASGSVTVTASDVTVDVVMTATPSGPTVIFSEDFAAGVMPPAGWSITPDGTTNWIIVTATYAGGESPEGKFYGWPGVVGTTRLITPIISTDGFATLELEFKDKTQGATNPDYSFKIETTSDGGVTWNEVWSITPNGSWAYPQVEAITIDNTDVGSTNFQYCISYVSTTNSGAYHYNFDDFVLTGIPAGYVSYSATYNVTDNDGDPIEGAVITMENNGTMTTNASGQAIFDEVDPGTFTYDITAVGFTPASGSVTVTDSDVTVDVEMTEIVYYDVTFNVSDGTNPIEGASVTIDGSTLATDATGQVVFVDIEPGTYTYEVTADGYTPGSGTVTVVDADVQESVVLTPIVYYTVTFNVSDGTNPIEGASVSINDSTQTTNASGQAIFATIEPETYTYTVAYIGYTLESGSVTVADADVTIDVVMGVANSYTLPFNEDFAGGVMPPTDWTIIPNGLESWEIKTTNQAGGSSPEGYFSCYLSGIFIGNTKLISAVVNTTGEELLKLDFKHRLTGRTNTDYSLKVETTSDGGATWNEVWSVTPGGSISAEEVSIIIDNSDVGSANFQYSLTYESTVNYGAMNWWFDDISLIGLEYYTVTFDVDDENADPIEGATVIVNDSTLTTDASGEATIEFYNGDYPYTVSKPGYFDETGTVTVADDDVTEDVVMEVRVDYNVTFNVTDGTNPMEGATISVNDSTLSTDASGEATLMLPNGNYPYTVSYDGYFDETGTVTVANADVTESVALELMVFYNVTFTVTDGTNSLEDATININDSTITTDATGVATIELPNGVFPYLATKTDYTQVLDSVTVAGADVTVDIELAQLIAVFSEYFDEGQMPPTGWSITPSGTANWVISQSSFAGGTSAEGKYYYFPFFTGTTRLVSPVINTSAYGTLNLDFLHNLTTAEVNNNYHLKVETTSDGGITWNEVWSITPGGPFPATTESLPITNSDVGSPNFQFCLTYESSVERAIWHYYFDNFILSGTQGADVYDVTYNISDEDGNPIEDVEIAMSVYGTKFTDAAGQAIYTDVVSDTYTWDITMAGFVEQSGTVTVTDSDVIADIEMEAIIPVFPFVEEFSAMVMPPEGWSINGEGEDNWTVFNSNNAGGVAPEAALASMPEFNGVSKLVSPVLPSEGISVLQLDFKYSVVDVEGGDYSFRVETTSDGGATWNEIWTVSPLGSMNAEEVSVIIDNEDVGSEDFQFAIIFDGNSTQINYWFLDDINVNIVSRDDLITEEFSGSDFPPEGWGFMTGGEANWGRSSTQNAGGEPSELYFTWGPPYFIGTSRFVSPTLETYGYTSLKLQFNHFVWVNGTRDYAYKVETSGDGGVTWNEIWTITPSSNIEEEIVQLFIDNEDVGSNQFKIAFTFTGNTGNVNNWFIDNIYLTDGEGSDVYPVTFAVNDEDGLPVEGATVNLEANGFKQTDASGEAVYENVYTGTYAWSTFKYRYETATNEVAVTDAGVTVDLVLEPSMVVLEEYFGGVFPPTTWAKAGDSPSCWNRSTMSYYAGGEAPEVVFTTDYNTFIGTSKFISPIIATSDFPKLFLDFKQAVDDETGSNYALKIETTSDGGTTWNEVWSISPTGNIAAQDMTVLINNSDAGSDNFQFAFTFDGNSENINRWYIDNVILRGALQYDAGITSVDMPALLEPGVSVVPSVDVINSGSEIISFDVTLGFTDGTYQYSETVSLTDIEPLQTETVNFPAWTSIEGSYEGDVYVTLVDDQNPDNNELSFGVDVTSGLMAKKPLYEMFTSSTCGPCVNGNYILDSILDANPNEYTLIKYQMNFPGAGDPYYTEEGGVRRDYYEVSGIPDLYINSDKVSPYSLTQPLFNQYLDFETALAIDITEAVIDEDHNITISADLTSVINYDAGLTAHMVVVEKQTTGNIGSNGETVFHHVMMKMLPGGFGATLGEISSGVPLTITESSDMDLTNMERTNDLAVIVFVQDDTDKSLVQSAMIDVTDLSTPTEELLLMYDGVPMGMGETITVQDEETVAEIICEMGIKNNYLEAKNIMVSKEIVWETEGHSNYFCWGECFTPEVFVSTDPITLQSGELNDEDFSGHLEPNAIQGTTTIKYTFFEENNPAIETYFFVDFVAGIPVTLDPPTNLMADVDQNDVTLTWTSPVSKELSSFNVYRDGEIIVNTTDVTYLDEDLSDGIYQYYVTAVYDEGESDPSNEVSVLIGSATDELLLIYEGELFEVGGTVTIQDSETASVILCEMGIQNNYTVPKNIKVSKEIISETTGHVNTFCWGACFPPNIFVTPDAITLEAGELNNEDFSGDLMPNGIQGTTVIKYTFFESENPDIAVHFFAEFIAGNAGSLNPPTNLMAEVDQDDVNLSWTSPASKDLIFYNVYRNDEIIGNTTETFYQDENLSAGTYTYYVTALYDEGESGPSNEVSIAMGAPLINVTPMEVLFDITPIDQTSLEVITIANQGTVTLDITDITSNEAAFMVDITTLSIEPGNNEDVTITFAPTLIQFYQGEITIQSNDPTNPEVVVSVSGEGDDPIGMDEFTEDGFVIYPNPAMNKFFIETSIDIERVQLINTAGQVVLEEAIIGNKTEINTNQLITGIYFVKVFTNEKMITKKLVIK